MLRQRSYINSKGEEVNVKDYQKRCWVCMLYDSNPAHLKALDIMENDKNTLIMCHDRSSRKNGELKDKHYHCLIQQHTYLFTLLDRYELDVSNAHLFFGLRDLNYRSLDDWIEYVCHYMIAYKEKYNQDDFKGTKRGYAIRHMDSLEVDEVDRIRIITDYIEEYYKRGEQLRYNHLIEYCRNKNIIDVCVRKWSFLRSLIDQNNKYLKDGPAIDRNGDYILP